MSRARHALKNSVITIIVQIITIILGFIVRKQFIESLGVMYLGYNSVFNNILSFLNLTELGIGVAITSFLYSPLAENKKEDIIALMSIYKKIYRIIALCVALIGIILIPLLPIFIPDLNINFIYLVILYIINIIREVSTYLLSYRRTLLIADQKSYIVNFSDMLFNIVFSLIQVFILYHGAAYEFYLLIGVAKVILSNLYIGYKTNKYYSYLNYKPSQKLVTIYKRKIYQYVKDIMISKIGGFIYNSTDNLIISIFKGSLLTGYLSNYTLITYQIQSVISHLLSSLQATFGNYVNEVKEKKSIEKMFSNYLFLNFFLGNYCMICFIFLIQPFISLFFSEKLLLGDNIVLLLGVNLLLYIMLQILSQMFVIFQLYRYDKFIVAISAFLNILISAGLVNIIGISGVLIGTLITSIIYLLSRLYILYNKIFRINVKKILKKLIKYFAFTIIEVSILSFSIENNIFINLNLFNLLIRGFLISLFIFVMFIVFFHNDTEFDFFIHKFKLDKYFYK